MEKPDSPIEDNDFKNQMQSLSNNISIMSWLMLFILFALIFGSNKVFVENVVDTQEKSVSTYDTHEPKTYCSEEGILYWINGVIEIDYKKQYILNVVYDKNQKPKKC